MGGSANDETSARGAQVLLIVSTVLVSWLGMMIAHEAGHAVIAWLTCGKVQRIVLPVIGFSRTDVFPNPHPLAVAWGGPVLGELIPLAAMGLGAAVRWRGAYLARFFAGYCCVANGAYIGAASFQEVGDAYPMLLFGSKPWHLWLFGLVSLSLGLWIWNGLGEHFGIGPRARSINRPHAVMMVIVLAAVVGAETVVNFLR